MSKLIPERPIYRRERLIVGLPVLAVFVLLFLSHIFFDFFNISSTSYLPKLLPMLIALLAPTVLFWMVRGGRYTKVLRFHVPRASHIPFLISAFFLLLSGGMLLSMLFGGTSTLGNAATAYASADYVGIKDALSMLFFLGVLPAILEELFFRGIVVAEYERRGAIRAVLMSALLFALAHFDLRNLAVYIFSGVFLTLVLFATDSLFSVILLHACYNAFSLFGQPYLNAFYKMTGSVALFVFLLVLFLLLSLMIFFGTGARIYRLKELHGHKDPRRNVPWNVQFYTILDALRDPPIILCVVLSVVGFIIL